MSDSGKDMLLDLAKHPHAKEGVEFRYSSNLTQKSADVRAVDELVDLGYATKIGSAIGFVILVITPAGEVAANEI